MKYLDSLKKIYMRGWNDASQQKKYFNPYKRWDCRRQYLLGFRDCKAGAGSPMVAK